MRARSSATLRGPIAALLVLAAFAAPGCEEEGPGIPEHLETTVDQCSNDIDDDGDGWTDCADLGCGALTLCLHPDAGDVPDTTLDTSGCPRPNETQCLRNDEIRRCEEGEWAVYACEDACREIGGVYIDRCDSSCGGGMDACCCRSGGKSDRFFGAPLPRS